MTIKAYILSMLSATLLCWASFGVTLVSVNPYETGIVGFALFYVSLALAIVGTAAVLGFFSRFILLKQQVAFRAVREAFRQSFLIAALVVIALFLASKGLFNFVNLILLVVGLSFLEFFMLGYTNES